MQSMATPSHYPKLAELVALFYDDVSTLGELAEVPRDALPDVYQRLLVHEEHMTVAVEAYHESLVDVEVRETKLTDTHYARKIILRRQSDRGVVQFGIMRVNLGCLSDTVRAEIEKQERPLGRILVRHNILRTIHLDRLWKVLPGRDLCALLELDAPRETYGRSATINLDGLPAVELLEIVAPADDN